MTTFISRTLSHALLVALTVSACGIVFTAQDAKAAPTCEIYRSEKALNNALTRLTVTFASANGEEEEYWAMTADTKHLGQARKVALQRVADLKAGNPGCFEGVRF